MADQRVLAMVGIVHEVVEGPAIPDLAQRRPQVLGEGADVAGVEPQRDHLADHRLDLRDDHPGFVGAAAIGQDDVAAVAGDAITRWQSTIRPLRTFQVMPPKVFERWEAVEQHLHAERQLCAHRPA